MRPRFCGSDPVRLSGVKPPALCCSYPELKPIQSINAHPSNCICIKFDPTGRFFATGSADALVSLWDVEELVCVRCFSRSDFLSFINPEPNPSRH